MIFTGKLVPAARIRCALTVPVRMTGALTAPARLRCTLIVPVAEGIPICGMPVCGRVIVA